MLSNLFFTMNAVMPIVCMILVGYFIKRIRLFDEKFFMYCEETDLCKRIKKAGYGIKFVSSAKIMHLESKSIQNKLLKLKIGKKSEFYYFAKHFPFKAIIIKIL